MKTHLECIPCFIRQSLEAAKMATPDKHTHEKIVKSVMNHLQDISYDTPPPELSREVHTIIRTLANSTDPYKKVKDQSNIHAAQLYPKLKQMVNTADDPLLMAIKLAIIGNVIDFGTPNRFSIEAMLEQTLHKDFVADTYPHFIDILKQAHSILYLADNAGEIFFDKLLLEELKKKKVHITYVVKANPIINDALLTDAHVAGIDSLAMLLQGDAGQTKSSPGILLKYASKEFLDYFSAADMVIAKGQGNYESLCDNDREIFFLLMVKCPLVAKDIKRPMGQLIFKVNR
jgi:uncharacterized protein with ATP-grasp and redox domains